MTGITRWKEGNMDDFHVTEENQNKDSNGVFFGNSWSLRPTAKDAKIVMFGTDLYWIPKWCEYDEVTGICRIEESHCGCGACAKEREERVEVYQL